MFSDNKLLGQFDLVGIPPAPRGVPQIEVTFDIDANGIVHVTAKDLGTKKETSIRITASQKLSDAEIEKMRKEAEAHAEEDKKRKEEVEMINEAETLVYSTEKLYDEFKGKVQDSKLDEIKKEVDGLKDLLKEEPKNVERIKAKLEEVNKVVQGASTELYQQAAQAQQAQGEPAGHEHAHPGHEGHDHEGGHSHHDHGSGKEKVVDAEVVDDEKDKEKKHKRK
jgi:molecular chaperone DnaK